VNTQELPKILPFSCSLNSIHFYKFIIEWLFFVYSKSEYTLESVSVFVRPSARLHDNSSQLHSIALKFCALNCLINILVEFEDEKDPSRNGWVIEKIVIIDQSIPGGYRVFFQKNIFLIIIHNIYKSTQFLTLILNLILFLNQIVVF